LPRKRPSPCRNRIDRPHAERGLEGGLLLPALFLPNRRRGPRASGDKSILAANNKPCIFRQKD
jgi:hypothetical protein